MIWTVVDEKYLDYLRDNVESRIPKSDYGDDKYKPFFGSLFEVGDLVYLTQISHAQPRHSTMKNSLDFYKIFVPDSNPVLPDRFVAVVNLNYMFPIHRTLINELEYKNIGLCRTFQSEVEKSKYIDLLKNELTVINTLNLEVNAQKLYEQKYKYPDDRISKRCFDFKALEKHATEYVKKKD